MIGSGFSGAALFHTTDGGASWTPVTDFQGAYVAVDFDGASGWAAAVDGTLYRTVDDGATWTESQLPGGSPSILDMDFWNAEHRLRGRRSRLRGAQRRRRRHLADAADPRRRRPAHRHRRSSARTSSGCRPPAARVSTRRPVARTGRSWTSGRRLRLLLGASPPPPDGDAWIAGWQGTIGTSRDRRRRRSTSRRSPPSPSLTTGLSVALHRHEQRPRRHDRRLAVGLRRRHDLDRAEPDAHLRVGRHLHRLPDRDRRRRRHRCRRATPSSSSPARAAPSATSPRSRRSIRSS